MMKGKEKTGEERRGRKVERQTEVTELKVMFVGPISFEICYGRVKSYCLKHPR